jgi:hypothetical protein
MEALDRHRTAVVLVGAQAIYLQAGEADLELAVAPYTTDADLSINPHRLGSDPRIAEAMTAAGFVLKVKVGGGIEPGTWLAAAKVDGEPVSVPVDLLVPEVLAPRRGRRDARLPDHGTNATRWTPGLEATIFDNVQMPIASLEPDVDPRSTTINVAGPGALLVAKAHKLAERLRDEQRDKPHRVKPKDAGDVIRLMRSPAPPSVVGTRLAELSLIEECGSSVKEGVAHLQRLFGGSRTRGVDLAVEAMAGALPEEFLRELAPAYMAELLAAYES